MAGVYGALVAAEGYLENYSSLVAARQTTAEAKGDRFIDQRFAEWDRSGWASGSGDSADPLPEIDEIWDLWASAHYVLLDHMKTNPAAAGEGRVDAVEHMRSEALRMTDDILQRGYLLNQAGERVYPKDGERGSARLIVKLER